MVSVSAETENVVLAAVSVMAVTEKSGFGQSLLYIAARMQHIRSQTLVFMLATLQTPSNSLTAPIFHEAQAMTMEPTAL